ncbi:MAG: hypothetical protein WBO58_19640, partial [Gammaproteobacteria bacterium]
MATPTNVKNNLSVVTDKASAESGAVPDPVTATAAASTGSAPVTQADAATEATQTMDLDAPELYLNRELTWLEFNRRVLHEAQDESNPLLERLKFVGIVSSNLDEFFMKRIGGLKQQ